MTQDMGRQFLFQTNLTPIGVEDPPEPGPRQLASSIIQEQIISRLANFTRHQISGNRNRSGVSEWDYPLLAALSHAADEMELEVHTIHFEAHQFRNPQARRIQDLQQSPIPEPSFRIAPGCRK